MYLKSFKLIFEQTEKMSTYWIQNRAKDMIMNEMLKYN